MRGNTRDAECSAHTPGKNTTLPFQTTTENPSYDGVDQLDQCHQLLPAPRLLLQDRSGALAEVTGRPILYESRGEVEDELMEDGEAAPLFSFGVIADIQYADLDDGTNFLRTRTRYYRNSLEILSSACSWWEEEEEEESARRPSFILQLGDIIDGFNSQHGASERALQTVMDELSRCSVPVHHVWGNHEFYNFTRAALLKSVINSRHRGEGGEGSMEQVHAYHFSPAPKFRFVVLDAYDLSIIGREQSSTQYNKSLKILREHNPNEDLNQPPGIEPMGERFVKFGGGFSQDQLDWLDRVLFSADEKEEKVTVVSHLPVHPFSTSFVCLAWNFEKMLALLNSHKSVVCFMAGHDHDGGYHKDASGVHHLTLEGVIETPPCGRAFGTVHVYDDKMVLRGKGRIQNRVLMYR